MYSISFQEDSLLPRERLVAEGAEQLSNQELLSILIRTGNKKETVFQVSQRILSTISSLNDLRNMTLQELQSISGIGRIKAIELQADAIELHTGAYAQASLANNQEVLEYELERIKQAVAYAKKYSNMLVNAGHGLTKHNVSAIADIVGIYELNIGHAIIADAVFVGLAQAVKDMKDILQNANSNR